MSGRRPSEKELKQALRLIRHVQNCEDCNLHTCFTGYGHFLRWNTTYFKEVKGEVEEYKAPAGGDVVW